MRVCELCGEEEHEEIPAITVPYSNVYEPHTSWSMSATIAWQADPSVMTVADENVRPVTAFVYPDADLKVFDQNGDLIAESVESYIDTTARTIIPAFYVKDADTGASLKLWIQNNGLLDCFVVSTPENKDIVKDIADLLHVRGMIDYSSMTSADIKDLVNMAACVNEAHGKIVILSEEAATRENIKLLESLAATVWVITDTNTRSLLTMYTRGVHGVLVDDYQKAITALEFFQDDKPTVLRIPLTIGHRGDPSVYVENTLDSAKGAFEEGVDSVENDIQLSTDGKLFILHDDLLTRLFGLEEIRAEDLTLEELQGYVLNWDDPQLGIIVTNEVSSENSRYGKLYGQDEKKEYTIPTLEEYITEFKGTGLIHDTEIKSANPAIIPVYKDLVNQYDAWDQFFSITFNKAILYAIYADYPELSIGALGFLTEIDESILITFGDQAVITEAGDVENTIKSLFGILDSWNATCNPSYFDCPKDILLAARHRGLTVWPWTYEEKEEFANDYLFGMSGLTTDYPWWTSNLIEEISSEDLTIREGEEIPKPQGRNKLDECTALASAEALKVEDLDDGGALMIWRYQADLLLGDESFGNYYLYSEPFIVKTEKGPLPQKYTITFDLNGGTLNGRTESIVMEASENETITIIEAPVKDGYSFVCWKGSEYQPGDQYVVEADHTFIAQWKKEGSPAVIPTNKNIPKKMLSIRGIIRIWLSGAGCSSDPCLFFYILQLFGSDIIDLNEKSNIIG